MKTTILDLLFLQNKDAGDSDSEKEQEELNELENLLKKHDPDFSKWVTGLNWRYPSPFVDLFTQDLLQFPFTVLHWHIKAKVVRKFVSV